MELVAIEPRLSYVWNRLASYRERLGIPGLVGGILVGDRKFSKALGVEDLQTRKPMKADSLLRIGSLTKPFSATMIARLVDQGECSWDLPIAKSIKAFNVLRCSNSDHITIRDGMSHRSGFANMTQLWYGQSHRSEYLLSQLAKAKPLVNHRSQFIYNNLIYGTSVQAACRQAGMNWRDLLEHESIGRLGLQSTSHSIHKKKEPIGYTNRKGKPSPVLSQPLPKLIEPSAGLIITMNDLLKWGQHCMRGMKSDKKKPIEINQELLREQIQIAPGLSYGIGFQLRNWKGHALVEHSGGWCGFSSYMALIPERQIGVFLAANLFSTSILSQSIGWIFDTLLDKSFQEPDKSPIDPYYASRAEGKYIANYGMWNNERATVSKSGKRLFLALPNEEKQEVKFQQNNDWHPLEFDANSQVRFEGTDKGNASSMSLRQGGFQFDLLRTGTTSHSNLEIETRPLLGVYWLKETQTEHLIIFYKGYLSLKVNGQMIFRLEPVDGSYREWRVREMTGNVSITFRRRVIGGTNGLILRQGGKAYKMPKIAPDPMQNLPKLADLWPSTPEWDKKETVSQPAWRQTGTVEMPHQGLNGVYRSEISSQWKLNTEIDFGDWGRQKWEFNDNKGSVSTDKETETFDNAKVLGQSMLRQPWFCSSLYHRIFKTIDIDFATSINDKRVYQMTAVLPEGPGITIHVEKQTKHIVQAEYIESSPETKVSFKQQMFFDEHVSTEIGYLPELTTITNPLTGSMVFSMKTFDRLN
jgi:CubicO group peptidase (beta-lactamase class C family)